MHEADHSQFLTTCYVHTGTVRDRQRPGRPRATTARTDRFITLTHLRQRFLPATATARHYGLSAQTVCNRLRKNNRPIRTRRPFKGQIMTRRHRLNRVQWARRRFIWRRADWNRVLFSNESRFALSHADGRIRVYRRTTERYADYCVLERGRFGGGSLIVWGGIIGGQKTDFVVIRGNLNARRYIDEILRPHVIPFLRNQGPNVTFQHDNARPHTALITRQFVAQNNVDVLP